MGKLIDEFRLAWRGISPPSPYLGIGFAAGCLALSTAARWGLSLIRPDVFFTPYFPAVVFATAFGGFRLGIATGLAGGLLGMTVNFSEAPADFARLVLLAAYLTVCGLTIWGVEHYRCDRLAAAGDCKAADPGRGVPQAHCRRAAASAEEQAIDNSRRSAPGATRSAGKLGQCRSAAAGPVANG